MIKKYILVALIVSIWACDKLEECTWIASRFHNTCTDLDETLDNMQEEFITYQNTGYCPGVIEDDQCAVSRKLCASCS